MGITEIPRSFLYTCDGCGEEHKQENAGGHYTESRPPFWSNLIMRRSAYDSGMAVADASIIKLLCVRCSDRVEYAIKATLPKRETTKSKGDAQ